MINYPSILSFAMTENILIAVAWPYANSGYPRGISPARTCRRYCRRCSPYAGRNVVMVSGSDSHGTAITIKATRWGRPKIYKHTTRGSSNYLKKTGHQLRHLHLHPPKTTSRWRRKSSDSAGEWLSEDFCLRQWFSPTQGRFLPFCYVEGTCYICGNRRAATNAKMRTRARSGETHQPRSKVDGSTPELRETEHFFLDLSTLEPPNQDFLKAREATGT